ncbi:Structural maintenance of chromosomes protein 4 [Pseudolycoriella hygida]|uniref:Structural maintenance of chromosomes protein 4 n=1 Tax=Pseudolycoriella hygida TaxID=35572 RepID=A0A9Q0N8Z5_9DIPT|nr:Structural maintenance of chromosomes protein 4 [Pseudolycoriella hygida]
MFKSKVLCLRFLNCCYQWAACCFTYYGLSLSSTSINGANRYISFMLVVCIEIPGVLISTPLLLWLKRRTLLSSAFSITAIAIWITPFIPREYSTAVLVFFMLAKASITCAFNSIYMPTAEQFPTNLRNTIMNSCSMTGRIGSTLLTLTVFLGTQHASLPAVLFASTSIIAGISTLFNPETLINYSSLSLTVVYLDLVSNICRNGNDIFGPFAYLIPSKNATEIAESETKIEKLTAEKTKIEEQLEKNLESLQDITQPLIEKKEKLQNDLLGFQTKVDECKAELTVSSNELKICQHSELCERRKYNSWKQSLEDSKTELDVKKKELKELQSNLSEVKKAAIEYREQLQERHKEENELTVQLRKLRSEVDEQKRNMNAMRSNNKMLDALMQQKIKGRIPGILGRLGDLGGIDAKYDVAISTCCGRLDNIVVDTVSTAQACIEYLKEANAGRATFIALEKVKDIRGRDRIQTPENVHRLYDLIKYEDPQVLPAFYFALHDTLVADDIEQATRIAYGAKRYRTVTLKGELIEISGSISGGGRPIRGRMGQQVKTKTSRNDANTSMSGDNLEEMQRKVEELGNRISYCQEQQGQLDRDSRNIDVQIKQKETAVKRLVCEVDSLEKSLPLVEQQCEAQKLQMETTKSDPAKVKELQSIIQKNEEALKVSEAEAKKIKDKVTEVEKKIKSITSEKVKSLETKIDDLTKQITKLSKNVSRLKVEVNTSERNCVKTQETIDNLGKEVVDAQEQVMAKNQERDETYKQMEEAKGRVREIEAEINKAQSGGTEIKKEILKLQEEEQQGKVLRVDIEQKLQAIDKLVNDVKEQLPKLKYRLKGLKLREIPKQDPQEPLKVYQDEELSTHKTKDLEYKISCLDEQIQATTTPNIGAIEEYYTRREVYLERVRVLEDITKKRNEMRHLYDEVRKRRHNEFKEGFNIITRKLREMYQMITQGGDAELELVDSMDPFTEGVSFSVRPPKKTWKNISNLSGGEKTLSSLALVFALHYYKPSPLYFMDEIDAALDFKNVSIVANYIRERTRNAQFIIISLRTNMFELSHCLTGIYKVHDCTQSLSMANSVPDYCLPQPSSQVASQQIDEPIRPSQESADSLTNGTRTPLSQVISSQESDVFDNVRNGKLPEEMETS